MLNKYSSFWLLLIVLSCATVQLPGVVVEDDRQIIQRRIECLLKSKTELDQYDCNWDARQDCLDAGMNPDCGEDGK